MLLDMQSITKQYGRGDTVITVLDHVHFTIHSGETACIHGASGIGKTTLIRIAAGLCAPTSGTVCFQGQDLYRLSESKRASLRLGRLGVVHQHSTLIEELTCYENIHLPLRLGHQKADDGWYAKVIDMLDINDILHSLVTKCSGGQRKRVEIARVLMQQPELLIADEPTANLDRHMANRVISLFQQYQEISHCGLMLITHAELSTKWDWNHFYFTENGLSQTIA